MLSRITIPVTDFVKHSSCITEFKKKLPPEKEILELFTDEDGKTLKDFNKTKPKITPFNTMISKEYPFLLGNAFDWYVRTQIPIFNNKEIDLSNDLRGIEGILKAPRFQGHIQFKEINDWFYMFKSKAANKTLDFNSDDDLKSIFIIAHLEDIKRKINKSKGDFNFNLNSDILNIHYEAIKKLREIIIEFHNNSGIFTNESYEYISNPNLGRPLETEDLDDVILRGDGDFILGDTLFEIKTTKELYARDVYQLILYYILSRKNGDIIFSTPQYNIDKLGFYFSYFGKKFSVEVADIEKLLQKRNTTWDDLEKNLVDIIRKHTH